MQSSIVSSADGVRASAPISNRWILQRWVPLPLVLTGLPVLSLIVLCRNALRQEILRADIVLGIALLFGSLLALLVATAFRKTVYGATVGILMSVIGALWFVMLLSYNIVSLGLVLLLFLPILVGYVGGSVLERQDKGTVTPRVAAVLREISILFCSSYAFVMMLTSPGLSSITQVPLTSAMVTTNAPPTEDISATYQELGKVLRPKSAMGSQPWLNWVNLISPEGDMIAGQVAADEGDTNHRIYTQHAFVWTRSHGYRDMSKVQESVNAHNVVGASRNGETVLLNWSTPGGAGDALWTDDSGVRTSLWSDARNWLKEHAPATASDPEDLDTFGHLWGVSGDGNTVFLGTPSSVLRWTPKEGFEIVPGINGYPTIRTVSENGDAIAGYSGGSAFLWTKRAGKVELPRLPNTGGSVAYGMSRDAKIIVGASSNHLVRWTYTGEITDLGRLPSDAGITVDKGPNSSSVVLENKGYTVSDDGKVIVGQSGNVAFIWTERTGAVPVREVLANSGADIASQPVAAVAVSADGKRVTGFSAGSNTDATRWRLTLK